MKNKKQKTLMVIGILLFLNGILNIIDDSRVLTYDITSVLSGFGFMIIGAFYKR
jgi:ABC-type transport system involved in multi-copper enzyme maturation permease subunit